MRRFLVLAGVAILTTTSFALAKDKEKQKDGDVVVTDKRGETAVTAESIGDPTKPGVDDDLIICKSYPKTGSRIQRTKVCKTARQWRQDRTDAKKGMDQMKDDGGRGGAPG